MQARKPFEQLHLLLVFQRYILLAGDGATVDLVAAGRIQREAAYHEIFVIADGGITFSHGGVIFQHVAEQSGVLIFNQCIGKHRDRCGGIEQWRRLKTTHPSVVGLVSAVILGGDRSRWQFGFCRVCYRQSAGQQDANAEQAAREPRCGLCLGESPVKHLHAQLQKGGTGSNPRPVYQARHHTEPPGHYTL